MEVSPDTIQFMIPKPPSQLSQEELIAEFRFCGADLASRLIDPNTFDSARLEASDDESRLSMLGYEISRRLSVK